MIQAYYKYKPASFEALALLVRADGKDRFSLMYIAEMMRFLMLKRPPAELPPSLRECLNGPKKPVMNAEKAEGFVDKMIRTFSGKGGKK